MLKDFSKIDYSNNDVLEDVISIIENSFGVTHYEVVKLIEPLSVPEITITIKLIPTKETTI